jgi:YD repeat-containing protein
MPAPVQEAVRRDYPAAEVVSSGHEWYDKDGSAHYHVKVKTPDGKTNSVEYDAAGKRLAD